MGRLVVEAQGTAATGAAQGAGDVDLATPGNSRRLPLVVSVSDTDGVAVTGLTTAEFTVDAKLVGPGGSEVQIENVWGGQDGFYFVGLIPATYQGTQYTWVTGRYVFAVTITRGDHNGQTVCAVLID